MTSPAVHIVTGIPFANTTFNATTSTFTIAGGNDYTSIFKMNYVLTVTGTSTTNDGYYEITGSVFNGTNTVVTVESYSTGTAYPGTVPFVSSGTGRVIWFNYAVSNPGLVWTQNATLTSSSNSYSAIATTGGTTLIVENNTGNVYKSTNGGTSWSLVGNTGTGGGYNGSYMATDGTTWVYGASPPVYSTDVGATWTTATGTIINAGGISIATNGSGTWIACGNVENSSGVYAYSTDDAHTFTSINPFVNEPLDVVPWNWNGSEFYMFGLQDNSNPFLALQTSPDGITWTQHPSSFPGLTGLYITVLPGLSGNYIVANESTNAISLGNSPTNALPSPDGPATSVTVPLDSGGLEFAFGGGSLYFAFDTIGGVANSSNGTSWQAGTLNFLSGDFCVNAVYDSVNSSYIAVGEAGSVSTYP